MNPTRPIKYVIARGAVGCREYVQVGIYQRPIKWTMNIAEAHFFDRKLEAGSVCIARNLTRVKIGKVVFLVPVMKEEVH